MIKVFNIFNLKFGIEYDKRFYDGKFTATMRKACVTTKDWKMLNDVWTVYADRTGNIRFIEHEEV